MGFTTRVPIFAAMIVAILLSGVGGTAQAVSFSLSFTDSVNPTPDPLIASGGANDPYNYQHSIANRGYDPAKDTLTAANIAVRLRDDAFLDAAERTNLWTGGVNRGNFTIANGSRIGPGTTLNLNVASYINPATGNLPVRLAATTGDFRFRDSTLTVTTERQGSLGPTFTGVSLSTPGSEISLPHTLGFEFQANTDLRVTNLGFYDAGQNGLWQSHQVGIFNMAGDLLTSTTVRNGAASPLDGFFRYEPVAPMLLEAGKHYVIAAVIRDIDKYLIYDMGTGGQNGFMIDPLITYIQNRDIYTGSDSGYWNELIFPTDTLPGYTAWFGPNFMAQSIQSFQPVPVPPSAALLGSGILALGLFRLRRKKSAR